MNTPTLTQISATKVVSFKSPIDLSNWLNINVIDHAEQERLMIEGIKYKRFHGTYQIKVKQ